MRKHAIVPAGATDHNWWHTRAAFLLTGLLFNRDCAKQHNVVMCIKCSILCSSVFAAASTRSSVWNINEYFFSLRWSCWRSVRRKLTWWRSSSTAAASARRWTGRASISRRHCPSTRCSPRTRWLTSLASPRVTASRVRTRLGQISDVQTCAEIAVMRKHVVVPAGAPDHLLMIHPCCLPSE